MADAALHALAIVSFLLVGVPSNVAVLWIYTRKNSRVAKNRFPLIFAALDLFSLVTSLPFIHIAFEKEAKSASDSIYLNIAFLFSVNGYLLALFMATVDKFYAVIVPFNYGKRRATIFKSAIAITLVPNIVLAVTLSTIIDSLGPRAFIFMTQTYNVSILLMFLTICILYTIIIRKLIRSSSKVKDSG